MYSEKNDKILSKMIKKTAKREKISNKINVVPIDSVLFFKKLVFTTSILYIFLICDWKKVKPFEAK